MCVQGDKNLAQADAFGAALHGNVALRPQMTPLLHAAPASLLSGAGSFAQHTPAAMLTGSLVITGQWICACTQRPFQHHSWRGADGRMHTEHRLSACSQGRICVMLQEHRLVLAPCRTS